MNRKGFASIIFLLIAAGVLVASGILYYATNRPMSSLSPSAVSPALVQTPATSTLGNQSDTTNDVSSATTTVDFYLINKQKPSAGLLVQRVEQCNRIYQGTVKCFDYVGVSPSGTIALARLASMGGDSSSNANYCLLYDDKTTPVNCFSGVAVGHSPSSQRFAFVAWGQQWTINVIDLKDGTSKNVYTSAMDKNVSLEAWSGPMGGSGYDVIWVNDNLLRVGIYDKSKTIPGEYSDVQYFQKTETTELPV